jgi:excinuclease ABC subunit A
VSVISVRGASEHNLKDVSVDVPKRKLVAFTGMSGSGKSSLVFDTIYAESFRRFLGAANLPSFVLGNAIEVRHSRPKVKAITGLPPALGLSQRQGVAGKLSTVGTVSGLSDLFRVYFAAFGDIYCRSCVIPLKPTPLSEVQDIALHQYNGKTVTIVAPIAEKRKGAFASEVERFRQLGYSRLRVNGEVYDLQDEASFPKIDAKKLNTIDLLIDKILVSEEKFRRLERALSDAAQYGKGVVKIECGQHVEAFNTQSACPQCGESSPHLDVRHFSHSSLGRCEKCHGTGAAHENVPEDRAPCEACGGSRLGKDLPIVRVCGKTLPEIQFQKLDDLLPFVTSELLEHAGNDKARTKVSSEILRLCSTLCEVGVGHLNLNRSASSLAPGDLQRIRLAAMMSNRLSGALYILDEPCQGLTASEVENFVGVLRSRVVDGASVVVVEHHPVFLSHCDVVFTMGPGAGIHGGTVVSVCEPPRVAVSSRENTNRKKESLSRHEASLIFEDFSVRGVSRAFTRIEQGRVNLMRGPTGSGKQSFLELALQPILESLRDNQRPSVVPCARVHTANVSVKNLQIVRPGSLVRTSRRPVAAALDVLPHIRALFSQLPQSQILGFTEMNFSWSSARGRCERCEGKGYLELKQRFGPPVDVECESCLGARLDARSLIPRFKGKNFAEIMLMSVEEARDFFANVRLIESRLSAACDFGLGYVSLGQGMDSLSGGELQRLLLTIELRRSTLEGSWFLLVHTGTGLHAPDIAILGRLMERMTAKGATFVMIENREEFLSYAGNVLDFC